MAFIVTDSPRPVSEALRRQLHLRVTAWPAEGTFPASQHTILFRLVNRPHERTLRTVATQADPAVVIITGHGHQASGGTFARFRHCCEVDDAKGLSALHGDNLLSAGRRL